MAEANEKVFKNNENCPNSPVQECAICLQPALHPAQLPCSHIFCFLCIKGIALQIGRCAMCREVIPVDYVFNPKLLSPLKLDDVDTYQWYYEGGSGWWQYDPRASAEIEESFQRGEKACNLLLAGFMYVIDFTNMLQYRQRNPVRRRKIKRDRSTTVTDKLGVAGLSKTVLSRQMDEVTGGMANLWTTDASSRSVQPGAETSALTSRFTRQDSENYGLESLGLGPDEYPSNVDYQAVSPSQRDGRCFNPRLDLGESGDEDSDVEEDIDDVEPRRIMGGPSNISSGAFRPLPVRAPDVSHPRSDLDTDD